MKRKAKVTETVTSPQTGSVTEVSFVDLPIEGMAETMEGPVKVKTSVMGGASFDFQSVKFTAEVEIENVEMGEIPEAQEMAENMCFNRVASMEPRAQGLLDSLLEARGDR
jgi:hypothetical protein